MERHPGKGLADMTERLDPPHRGRPPVYPWSTWTNGQIHRAVHGKQFSVEPEFFGRAVRQHAKRIGKKVVVRVGKKEVRFQFEKGVSEGESQR